MSRICGVDLLRGIAAFGIVGCHLSLIPRTSNAALVTALCDFNVGLFAALSGFLMHNDRLSCRWAVYVGKRAGRLLPTYFSWSCLFIFATALFDLLLDGGRLNPRYGSSEFWTHAFFFGGAATHLWFLICLFYAQSVLISGFKAYSKGVHGLMWICFGGAAVVGSVCFGGWFGLYPLRLAAFLMTGYGLACLCAKAMGSVRKYRITVWCVCVAVLFCHVLMRGVLPGFIRDWIAVMPVLLGFVLLDHDKGFMGRVSFLGATSMGVYLVHPLFTRGLSVLFAWYFSSPYGVLPVLCEWILAWLMSLAFAMIALRVPVLRRFVR